MSEPLLNREVATLMLTMRRLVRDEFGESVSLGAPDAPQQLYRLALRSRRRALQEMAVRLDAHFAHDAPADNRRTRYYRGAPILEEPRRTNGGDHARTATVRVYRGNIVDP